MIEIENIPLIATVILGLVVAIFDSVIWGIFIGLLFATGTFWGVHLLRHIGIILRTDIQKNADTSKQFCRVCSGKSCNRHRPSVFTSQVKVPKDFDHTLQNLLEKVLQTYICTWYSDLSSDGAFLLQLRAAIATGIRTIVNRLLQVDISRVIFNNLIPIALQHAEDWKLLSERARKEGGKPEDYALEYLGHKIHPAALSRDAEVCYLRGLVTALLPHLLPNTYVSTNNKVILREILSNWVLLPAIDALANPDNINFLVELCTQYEGTLSEEIDAINVPVLQSWITPFITNMASEDPLKPPLEEVLNNPDLLYLFMQHIKETGPVNLLQFCLDIDDISKRMLNPEMTPEIEENLFIDAQNIYSTYLDPNGSEYLNLPCHISQGMQQILDGGVDKIQELRTSRPLYQAHQEAHALLEAVCLPPFHHSYELYKLLCGPPVSNTFVKQSGQNISGGIGVGTRLTNQLGKIRGALRASAVDGAPFETQDVFQAEEVDCSPRTYDDVHLSGDKSNRDLTAWRVTIPHVDGGGTQPLYMIAIHSVAEDKSWTVLRRDQDFYALRARLMEFHGDRELNDSPLPSRKNQNVSLTTNRQRYQEFLQRLLAKPTLRSSELLHTFLTVPNLKPYFTNYSTPDIGVLYQSVAHKLRKEKGQNLDKFMNKFLASTSGKVEHPDLSVELAYEHHYNEVKQKRRILTQDLFGNNLNISNNSQSLPFIPLKKHHVKGACFCIAEAVGSLLDVAPSISKVTWLVASLSRSRLDPICNKFLDKTLTKLLSGGRAAIVIELLHNTIFDTETLQETGPVYTKDEKMYKSAKEGLHSLLPWWMIGLCNGYWAKMMDALFEPLQCAALNKHLAYVLVDQVVATLFPELSK